MRVAALALSLFFAGAACNNNDFAGAARREAADAKPKKKDEGEDLGTKTKVDDKSKDKKEPKDDGDVSDPTVPTGEDQAGGDPDIVDILAGLLGSDSDIVPNQPDDNTIDFGDDKFFHIGDNELTATSCKLEVTLAALAGTQFYFEFEVKKDDTDVALDIGRVCGVDYGDSNEVRIIKTTTATEVTKQTIAAGDAPIKVEGKGLGIGKYMVIVESLQNAGNSNDRDDYLVGEVTLKASKPIKAGKVGAK